MSGFNGAALLLAIGFCIAVVRVGYLYAARLEHRVQRWAGDIPVTPRPDDAVQAAWVERERQVQLDRSMRRKP